MLRIRLQRRGRKKRPIHHIVVADNHKPRDGRIVEDLGRFDNITSKNQLDLDRDRALYWLKEGAQPSDTVRSIFKEQGLMYHMHLIRWGKSEGEIEEALAEWRENREQEKDSGTTRKERQQAMLEAEEKEFQKQLKKKAEEAAKEQAKQEALASDEDEEQEAEAAGEEASDEEETEASANNVEEIEEPEEEIAQEASDEEESEEQVEAEAQEEEEADEDTSEGKEVEAKEEDEEETETEEQTASSADEEKEAQTSTDMLAKEAISHIEDTPLEDLEGFVTDDEDRVTVQRAWEEKQENN